MYKMRMYIWGTVLFVFLAVSLIPKIFVSKDPIYISCEQSYLRRNIDQKKINEQKFNITTKDADIIISNNKEEGYSQELFYSPFIAMAYINNAYTFQDISNTTNTVRIGNLKPFLNAFLENKTYLELDEKRYTKVFGKDIPIKIAVVDGFEYETKAQFILTLSEKSYLSEEDVKQYCETANKLYDMCKKIDIDDFKTFTSDSENKMYIIICPEYMYKTSQYFCPISLGNSIGLTYYVNYKNDDRDLLNNMVLTNNFMRGILLRRDNFCDRFYKGVFKGSDWTVNYIPYSDIEEIVSHNYDDNIKNASENTQSNNTLKENEIMESSNNDDSIILNTDNAQKKDDNKEENTISQKENTDYSKIIEENRNISENAYENNDEKAFSIILAMSLIFGLLILGGVTIYIIAQRHHYDY